MAPYVPSKANWILCRVFRILLAFSLRMVPLWPLRQTLHRKSHRTVMGEMMRLILAMAACATGGWLLATVCAALTCE